MLAVVDEVITFGLGQVYSLISFKGNSSLKGKCNDIMSYNKYNVNINLSGVDGCNPSFGLALKVKAKSKEWVESKPSTAQGQKWSEIFIKGKCDKAKVKLKCMDHMETLLTCILILGITTCKRSWMFKVTFESSILFNWIISGSLKDVDKAYNL